MIKSKVRFSLLFLAAVIATTLTFTAVNATSAYETHCARTATSQSEVLVLLAQR